MMLMAENDLILLAINKREPDKLKPSQTSTTNGNVLTAALSRDAVFVCRYNGQDR